MSVAEPDSAPAPIYESRASRIALMYRMSGASKARRTLVLTVPGREPLALPGLRGEVVPDFVGHEVTRLRRHAEASFDSVVLHWALDEFVADPGRRRSRAAQRHLLREVRRLLVPGGVVTGCVANFLSVGGRDGAPLLGHTWASCARLLDSAGYVSNATFLALPSADTPRVVVSTAFRPARHYFRLQLARSEGEFGRLSRFVRTLLIETGGNCHLQGSLVFSGTSPC